MTLLTTPVLFVSLIVLTAPAASPIASRFGAMTFRPSGCFNGCANVISVIAPAAPVVALIGILNSLPDCALVPWSTTNRLPVLWSTSRPLRCHCPAPRTGSLTHWSSAVAPFLRRRMRGYHESVA